MQGQLEVTGLTECDFVVCRVRVSEEACKGAMMEASDPALRSGRELHGRILPFPSLDRLSQKLLQFKDYHMAQGAEVGFHHVFDFTVTGRQERGGMEEMEQKLARGGACCTTPSSAGAQQSCSLEPRVPIQDFLSTSVSLKDRSPRRNNCTFPFVAATPSAAAV
jgi:hypothetical protein